MTRYWMQTQTPSGEWADSLGVNELDRAVSHAIYHWKTFQVATRVVLREDTEMVTYEGIYKEEL